MKRFLILFLAIVLSFSLSLSVFAEEGVETATSDASSETTLPEGPSDAVSAWDKVLDKLTSSTMWISVGTYVASAFALYELIKKRFSGVTSLINDKSDTKTIVAAVSEGYAEIKDKLDDRVKALSEKVDAEQQTIDKMMVVLSVFMAHAKINEHARAEIMLMLTGVKTYTGNLAEIVEKVTETVEAAMASEEKIETPALDEIASEKATAEEILIGGM